jgi:hypothetical protein
MTENQGAFTVNAVLYEQGDWWIGQCLEYDITTQAHTFTELQYELERVVFSHVFASIAEGRKPFEGLPEAPPKFWRMWEAGSRIERKELTFRPPTPMPMPPFELKTKIGELVSAAVNPECVAANIH